MRYQFKQKKTLSYFKHLGERRKQGCMNLYNQMVKSLSFPKQKSYFYGTHCSTQDVFKIIISNVLGLQMLAYNAIEYMTIPAQILFCKFIRLVIQLKQDLSQPAKTPLLSRKEKKLAEDKMNAKVQSVPHIFTALMMKIHLLIFSMDFEHAYYQESTYYKVY